MRETFFQRHRIGAASADVGVEWPSAKKTPRPSLGGRLATATDTVVTDLGDRGVQIATGLAACIAALATLGAVNTIPSVQLPPFDLNGENYGVGAAVNAPALFSAAILFGAAAAALVIATHTRSLPWVPLGAFFAFMGVDELFTIHETLERQLAIDWQILYLPVILAGGAYWLLALRRMRVIDTAWTLWLAGAGAWFIAQGLEFVANARADTWVALSKASAASEEVLEMVGSSLFLLALLIISRRIRDSSSGLRGQHART